MSTSNEMSVKAAKNEAKRFLEFPKFRAPPQFRLSSFMDAPSHRMPATLAATQPFRWGEFDKIPDRHFIDQWRKALLESPWRYKIVELLEKPDPMTHFAVEFEYVPFPSRRVLVLLG